MVIHDDDLELHAWRRLFPNRRDDPPDGPALVRGRDHHGYQPARRVRVVALLVVPHPSSDFVPDVEAQPRAAVGPCRAGGCGEGRAPANAAGVGAADAGTVARIVRRILERCGPGTWPRAPRDVA